MSARIIKIIKGIQHDCAATVAGLASCATRKSTKNHAIISRVRVLRSGFEETSSIVIAVVGAVDDDVADVVIIVLYRIALYGINIIGQCHTDFDCCMTVQYGVCTFSTNATIGCTHTTLYARIITRYKLLQMQCHKFKLTKKQIKPTTK